MIIIDETWQLDCKDTRTMHGILGYARMRGVPLHEYIFCACGPVLFVRNGVLTCSNEADSPRQSIDYDQFRQLCDEHAPAAALAAV